MRAVGALQQNVGAGLHVEFAGLEFRDERQLLGGEVPQHFLAAQRTFLAGHLASG